MFLCMEPNLGEADYVERGFILQDLLTEFFSQWSDLVGEVIGLENKSKNLILYKYHKKIKSKFILCIQIHILYII